MKSYIEKFLFITITQLELVKNNKQLNLLYPYLPYVLIRLENGNFLPINRAYKPLGIVQADWVDYNAFPFLELSPDSIDLSFLNSECGKEGYYYFYEDATSPRLLSKNRNRYAVIMRKALKLWPSVDTLSEHGILFDGYNPNKI